MDNPHYVFTRRTTPQLPGFPATYDVHSYNANVPPPTDATTLVASQEGATLSTMLTPMFTPMMDDGSFDMPWSGFIQNDGSHINENISHGPNHPGHNLPAQFATTSSHSTSSNPAPVGEATWGTTHQTFSTATVSYPDTEPYGSVINPLQPSQASGFSELPPPPLTFSQSQAFQNVEVHTQQQAVHTFYGYSFSRSQRKPVIYQGISLVPQDQRYRPNGYIYIDGLGIQPYFVRSEKDLQTNHALVGYLQKEGSRLDKRNRLWHHYHTLDELEVVHPATANLMSILQQQTRLGSMVVRLELHRDMGSDVHSPITIIVYKSGDPVILEHGESMLYPDLRDVLLAPQDPTQDTASHWMPGQDDEVDDEDEDEDKEVGNEFYLPKTFCISKGYLQKHAPSFKKLLDRTLFFFHVKLLKGEYFHHDVLNLRLSPGERQRVDSVCCHSAWAEALAFSETGEYEKSLRIQNSLRSPVRIIVEDHFPHILANQKRAAEAYYSVILLQVNLLVDKMGLSAYLDLFSYGTDPQQFYAAASATTTLCDTNGTPFHHVQFMACLRRLFHGPVPPTLTNWPRPAQSVGTVFFKDLLTEQVVAVCAAHWLLAGIRRIGGFNHSSMPHDIRKLVEVMQFRLSVTPPDHIISLQAIINSHAAV